MRVDQARQDDHVAGVNHPIGLAARSGGRSAVGPAYSIALSRDEDRAVGDLLPIGIHRNQVLDVANEQGGHGFFSLGARHSPR